MTQKQSSQKKKKTLKLRKTIEKVRILSLATPCVRKQLVQQGGREIVDCISECCVNILKGNVRLTPKQNPVFPSTIKNSEKLQRKKSV